MVRLVQVPDQKVATGEETWAKERCGESVGRTEKGKDQGQTSLCF
jgi:hypothetical protein